MTAQPQQSYPASVSIAHLLKAGKFVKPVPKIRTSLHLESFDVSCKEWRSAMTIDVHIEEEKFAEGGFRSAYKCTSNDGKVWVLKKYHDATKKTITDDCALTVEVHARKQVQMHAVARHITGRFCSQVPAKFGKSFTYNRVYYAKFAEEPVTVEELVAGKFLKYVNNDGTCVKPSEDEKEDVKDIFLKAQCLVHMSYVMSEKQLMLLDIQGSGYSLYDPEMATTAIQDENDPRSEFYFCCGNLSSMGIDKFLKDHKCNRYCHMFDLELHESAY